MEDELRALEEHLDALITRLLPPLRGEKRLDAAAFAELLALDDSLAALVRESPMTPTRLVGKCWFVFTAMLAEADHARDAAPIFHAAWQWQERLRLAYGPRS